MKIAVCDDCREDAMYVASFLSGHKCDIFSSPAALLLKQKETESLYDLYLLDICMGEEAAGIDLAKKVRERDTDAAICFISSSDAFYREAYDIQDVNYLLKPVSETALLTLVERVERRQLKSHQQSFHFKWNGQMVSVPYSNILYINSNDHILDIYCKDGSVRHCSAKLDDVEPLLDGRIFFRCHQSFLVNLYSVDYLRGSDFVIGKILIPISRRYFAETKRRYQEILFEEVT